MRGLAGTGRGGVSMAAVGGGNAMFCLEFAYVFRLSVSMRKVAGEHPFCVLIYMNSYIPYLLYFIYCLVKNTYLIFDFICLTLSLADTHGIAKYARTYTQRYTHTYTHTQKRQSRKSKNKRERKTKEGGVREERKKRKGKGQKENEEKRKNK